MTRSDRIKGSVDIDLLTGRVPDHPTTGRVPDHPTTGRVPKMRCQACDERLKTQGGAGMNPETDRLLQRRQQLLAEIVDAANAIERIDGRMAGVEDEEDEDDDLEGFDYAICPVCGTECDPWEVEYDGCIYCRNSDEEEAEEEEAEEEEGGC